MQACGNPCYGEEFFEFVRTIIKHKFINYPRNYSNESQWGVDITSGSKSKKESKDKLECVNDELNNDILR